MASINTFECDCGYSLTTAWGPDQGYWYRTYKCNNCKNYIIGKHNGPRRNRVFSLVNGEKVRIKAIGFYNEDAQNGEAYKFNQAYCEVCGSNDLLELEDSDMVDSMSILKPFSFVLENEELDMPYELYLADGDTVIVDTDLMEGLNDDLDDFFQKLMKN